MAVSRGMILFLLLLLVAADIGTIEAKKRSKHAKKAVKSLTKDKEEEEDHCLSQSHQFKGYCFSSDTCAEVCKKESFTGGECKLQNALRKCFCKKPC